MAVLFRVASPSGSHYQRGVGGHGTGRLFASGRRYFFGHSPANRGHLETGPTSEVGQSGRAMKHGASYRTTGLAAVVRCRFGTAFSFDAEPDAELDCRESLSGDVGASAGQATCGPMTNRAEMPTVQAPPTNRVDSVL